MRNILTTEIKGKIWFCYGNNRPVPCPIFKDFRDIKEKCPAKHFCSRIDKGNYDRFC